MTTTTRTEDQIDYDPTTGEPVWVLTAAKTYAVIDAAYVADYLAWAHERRQISEAEEEGRAPFKSWEESDDFGTALLDAMLCHLDGEATR